MTNQSDHKEQGQGFVEYLIIIALVSIVVIVIVNVMRPAIENVFSRFVEQAAVSPPTLFDYTPPPPSDPNQPDPCYGLFYNVFPESAGNIDFFPQPDCPDDNSKYASGTQVRLVATSEPNFVFDRWSESAGGQRNNEAFIIMSSERSVTAYFADVTNCHTVAQPVASPTEGGSASIQPGPNCGSQYADGTLVEFRAAPASGFGFVGWGGDLSGSSARQTLTIENDLTNVVANFDALPCYTVTVAVDPDGGGDFNPNPQPNCGNNQYAQGTYLTLQAEANEGYTFDGWSGDHSSGSASISFTVDSNKTVTASFNECYTISWEASPSEGGVVTPNSAYTCGEGYYLPNTNAQIFAQAQPAYSFANWGGDHSGSSPLASILMNGNKSVVANFSQCHTVTTAVSPNGTGTINRSPQPNCAGGTQYSHNTQLTFTAVPADGYQFTGWSGSNTSNTNPLVLLAQSAINLTANFEPIPSCDNPTMPLLTQINFQPSGFAAPSGYLADTGAVFGDRGNGFSYGWNSNNSDNTRRRNSGNSPDFLHDTLNHMQQGGTYSWEIALANGTYEVCIVAGDPAHTNSHYRINAEGTLVVDHQPTNNNRWGEGMALVTVNDGRLSITNASGSSNNKINFIRIHRDQPVLLSENGTATANNYQNNGTNPSMANDGDFGTYWQGGNAATWWWRVDLQNSHDLTGVDISFRDYNYTYQVQISSNGTDFTTVASGNNVGGLQLHGISATARYVRINVTNVSGNNNRPRINEVQVFGYNN